jgi:nucleotide-binding universal stress UspA family protein
MYGVYGGRVGSVNVPGELVVGYDGSNRAREALRFACRLAGPDSAVSVIHAYELPSEIAQYDFFSDFKGAWLEVTQEVLDSARDCVAESTRVTYEAVSGKPADVLAEAAQSRNASLIVLGGRGTGSMLGALGSVTHRVLHRAPCPVLVVPDRDAPAVEDVALRAQEHGQRP